MIYDLPPILQGSTENQLQQLRDYLARIASKSSTSGSGNVILPNTTAARKSGSNAQNGAQTSTPSSVTRGEYEDLYSYSNKLKALIIKTANTTQEKFKEYDGRIESIDGLFFYIRYSPVPEPFADQITIEPQDDTAYMGVCSTNSETAPTDPEEYVWSRILGENALSLQIFSTNGNVFKNGAISTTLYVKVWSGEEEITDIFDDNDFCWTRVSDDPESDEAWNHNHFGGAKQITITPEDVYCRATFFCNLK